MKFLYLIWRNLMRKKARTFLTLMSIFIAFLLFGLLSAIKTAFGLGVELTGVDRLIMLHKVSIIQPLPISYMERIQADENVVRVAYATWFGGIYQEPKNQFPQIAVDPEDYLALYPEFVLPDERREAWIKNRTGAVVGRALADKYGFKVGDRVPIQGTIWRPQDGSNWEFTIEGIYDGAEKGTDTTQFVFHYDYLSEATGRPGLVGWYVIRIDDPENAAAIAERLDGRFANSPAETKTSTEKAFVQSFANQMGNISAIVTGIVSVVFFTLLLVAGNTMAQSVRERTGELAVMKTLGFSDALVMRLVLGESLLLAVLGGGTGLLLIWWVTQTTNLGGTFLPALFMPASDLVVGGALVFALGLVTGALPGFQALRLNIVEALRRS